MTVNYSSYARIPRDKDLHGFSALSRSIPRDQKPPRDYKLAWVPRDICVIKTPQEGAGNVNDLMGH